MEIKINGTLKEIADLALVLQNRRMVNLECTPQDLAKQVMKGVELVSNQSQKSDEDKVDFAAAQKIILDTSKKVREKRTLSDIKRNFQKIQVWLDENGIFEEPIPFRKENT